MSSEHKIVTKAKLLEVLKKIEGTDHVEIVNCSIGSGTDVGENYSSELEKVDLEVKVKKDGGTETTKSYHWMIKLPLSDAGRKEFHRAIKVEENEVLMYSDFLPKLKALIKERKANFDLDFVECPHAEIDENSSMIIMENMKYAGYEMAPNKNRGLSEPHIKLCLEALAKYHAASYAYLKSYPGGAKEGIEKNAVICRDYVIADGPDELKDIKDQMNKSMAVIMKSYISSSAGEGQDFLGALQKYVDEHGDGDVFKARDNLVRPKEDEFNVVFHGDPWFNNVLFKHENSVPTKAVLVDLAVTRYGNPCNDLNYFSFLSISPEDRKKNMKQYLNFYHQKFTNAMKELKEDPDVYPLSQLLSDFKKYQYFGFISCSMVMPGMLARKEDAFTPEDMQGDWTDKVQLQQIFDRVIKKAKVAFQNEPYMKTVLAGAFMDLVDNGHFKL